MDIKKVEQLIKLAKSSDIAELELLEGEDKLRITLSAPKQVTYAATPEHVVHTVVPPQANTTPAPSVDSVAQPGNVKNGHVVKSPMVGTFYSAPSPSAKAFVEVGQKIKAKQVLCIIEAMKLMNQIESDVDGSILEVLAKDGDPIEFGQPLFIVG